MEQNFAYVKKYKAVFNLIISIIILLFVAGGLFCALQIRIKFTKPFLLTCLDFLLSFAMFIIGLIYTIKNFKKQRKFNKSTPVYYVSIKDNETLKVNNRYIKVKNITQISYEKTADNEFMNSEFEKNVLARDMDGCRRYHKVVKNSYKKQLKKHEQAVQKSTFGNIMIQTNSFKLTLKRVKNVETTVNDLIDLVENMIKTQN